MSDLMNLPMVCEPLLASVKENLENQTDHFCDTNILISTGELSDIWRSKHYNDVLSMQRKLTDKLFSSSFSWISFLSFPPSFIFSVLSLSWLQTIITFLIIILYLAPSWHISYFSSGFYWANPVK